MYSHRSVTVLDYFCGFIDGRNALQSRTIWNIHLKPNINIHFLKFVLFNNYWYCDYEYLRVSSNNKLSTFCGNRLPWVHDASTTSVKIILMTHVQRAGTKNYQLELLYYAAYVPNYKHFVIFIQPSSLINMHFPNTEQNAFESFHFISSNKLDIMEIGAKNICNKGQVVCYDGPGFKSPVLQFTYNQTVWKCLSSTFQMMCKFSRVDDVCTNGPCLRYHAIRARDHQVIHGTELGCDYHNPLIIDEPESKGTTKYIFYHHLILWDCLLIILKMDISFPYMLSEGDSCMYGGLYIVQSILSKDSERLSLCTSTLAVNRQISELNNIYVIIIHYSEYSREGILFHANYSDLYQEGNTHVQTSGRGYLDLNQKYKEDILSITCTVPSTLKYLSGFLHSYQLRLRKIYYINISFDAFVHLEFHAHQRASCINITIFYPPDLSNICFIPDHYKEKFSWKTYDRTTPSGHRPFIKRDFIQSVVINMSACSFVRAPVWELFIEIYHKDHIYFDVQRGDLVIHNYSLPAAVLDVVINPWDVGAFQVMFYMRKPENVPVHTIWRVWIDTTDIGLRAFIEVLFDHSSSFYTWDYLRSSNDLYITVNKAVNILLQSNSIDHMFAIWFARHFIHDERISKYITGQTPKQFHFSFHNQR